MNYRYLIIKTTDVPDAEEFLTAFETKQYKSFTVEKRAKEWLAGRYAVKQLAAEFFNLPFKKLQVKMQKTAHPFCRLTVAII